MWFHPRVFREDDGFTQGRVLFVARLSLSVVIRRGKLEVREEGPPRPVTVRIDRSNVELRLRQSV